MSWRHPHPLATCVLALALFAGLGAAPAAEPEDPISRSRLDSYDYSVEIEQTSLNNLLAKFTALDSRRTDVDRKLKELKVQIGDGGGVDLVGAAELPVVGGVRFRFGGQFSLAERNVFEYKFDKFSLTKELGGANIPLTLLKGTVLSLFSILTRNKKLTEYLEISTSWSMAIPLLPTGWKSVYFTLKPKAMPVLERMDTVYLGREGSKIVLQGRLR
ncbi:MAG: hypothetical protein HYY25_09900 [Candidatus Wallbacteria bacterium]|nr:hypothetical protein [Candidatus Wallbacteria bacterium]